MKPKGHFIKSCFSSEDWLIDDIPEVAFIGRSNVGKSSLINSLAKHKIAFTSKTPGRTQMLNMYDFNEFRLVDFPGYGYAKVSGSKKNEFYFMSNEYFTKRSNLRGVFIICDSRVITEDDQMIVKYFKSKYKSVNVIVNKMDKLSNNEVFKLQNSIYKHLNLEKENIIYVSATKGNNINQIFSKIKEII
jgi:GTP-binding protein